MPDSAAPGRRRLMAATAAATTAAAATRPAAAQSGAAQSDAAQSGAMQSGASGKTFVLLHGAWHGGWCWRDVADGLRRDGHRVFTPTQTGLGERAHLLSGDVTLDTFVADLLGVFAAEEIEGAVLVGHSFGGSAISGVADRAPGRVRHLVYLDSLMLDGGQSPFGNLPAEVVAARRRQVIEQGGGVAIPAPPVTAFGIPENHPGAAWVARRLTPHPAGTYESPLRLANPVGNGRPRTYLACVDPAYAPLEASRRFVRERGGFEWREICTGHDAMVTAAPELVRLLGGIG